MKKRIALFPGSFDPFTKGHQDIVLRGLNLFDEIIIAMAHRGRLSVLANIFQKDLKQMLGEFAGQSA